MQPNWQNRTMWTGDSLDIIRGMNSESVDLIYLAPLQLQPQLLCPQLLPGL